MPRPALEVAEIFRSHGAAWRKANAGHLSLGQLKAMTAIEACRTAKLGGHVAACHDLSDGGLAVALAEKAFAGGYGIKVSLNKVTANPGMREDQILFSESQSRLLVTVRPEHQATFETLFKEQSCQLIGKVTVQPELLVSGEKDRILISSPIDLLKEAWQAPLREM